LWRWMEYACMYLLTTWVPLTMYLREPEWLLDIGCPKLTTAFQLMRS
jgi:hypothetical protein